MPDIATAYVQIVPTTKGIKQALTDEISGSGEGAGLQLGSKLKNALIAAGIGTAITKIIGTALSAGGDLQQSFGGLDTIYGEASEAAKQYAAEAAKAGISANDYAEQAVSFGASLKQAFGGDTTAAVEAANTAIMDMADNSAKFGTDISSVQAAYQGFAKGNYTMLDNLKLGFGGTKSEMERLLATAEKLPSAMGKSFDINNLGDVYEAIHLIQEDLGVAGVAAGEAATTLTGSIGAIKASFENLMASLSLGDSAGINTALQGLADSVLNFLLNNLFPMLMNILNGLPDIVINAITMIGTYSDELINTGLDLILALIEGIFTSLPAVASAMVSLGASMIATLTSIDWISLGLQVITTIATGISGALDIIGAAAIQVGTTILTKIGEFVSKMKDAGKNLLLGLKDGILGAVSSVVEAAKNAGKQILDGITNFFKIGSPSKLMADEVGRWIPAGIAEGIQQNLGTLMNTVSAMDGMTLATSVNAVRSYKPAQTYDSTSALANALQSRENVAVNVVLQGDAAGVFKLVRNQNNVFSKSTGRSAF